MIMKKELKDFCNNELKSFCQDFVLLLKVHLLEGVWNILLEEFEMKFGENRDVLILIFLLFLLLLLLGYEFLVFQKIDLLKEDFTWDRKEDLDDIYLVVCETVELLHLLELLELLRDQGQYMILMTSLFFEDKWTFNV